MSEKRFESEVSSWKQLPEDAKEKKVKELNDNFLEALGRLRPEPTGRKTKDANGKGGIEGSKWAADFNKRLLKLKDLKSNFEIVGWFYDISPALLAGIGSRESNLGVSLNNGWGDLDSRKGGTGRSYHGFGILQIDRLTGDVPEEVLAKLNRNLNTNVLDPYDLEWIRWGGEVFSRKLNLVKSKFPTAAPEVQMATAVSRYNGGSGSLYPDSDIKTTGNDYANDTLVRAKYYAENWGEL